MNMHRPQSDVFVIDEAAEGERGPPVHVFLIHVGRQLFDEQAKVVQASVDNGLVQRASNTTPPRKVVDGPWWYARHTIITR